MSRNDDTINDIKKQVDRIRDDQLVDKQKKFYEDLNDRFPYPPPRSQTYEPQYRSPTTRAEAKKEIRANLLFSIVFLAGSYYFDFNWDAVYVKIIMSLAVIFFLAFLVEIYHYICLSD